MTPNEQFVPEPLIKLLLAMVEIAQRNNTRSVSYVAQQSQEEFGAVDVMIQDYTRKDAVVIQRLRGAPLGELEAMGHVRSLGKYTVFLEDAAFDLMRSRGMRPTQVETMARYYLESAHFQTEYPDACQKWVNAAEKLWGSEPGSELTTIGHLCREAMQSFATALVNQYTPTEVDLDAAHTDNRVKAVLQAQTDRLGSIERPFLCALVEYWRKVSDLVQRQEHGAQKEGEPLAWEDARRVVFHAMITMFEIDRALSGM